jgi:PmbA protein
MTERVAKALKGLGGVSDWRIAAKRAYALERYFIGKKREMARGSEISLARVTLYVDSGSGSGRTRGAASCDIRPAMDAQEIRSALERCRFAAERSPGPWFPLPEPCPPARWVPGPFAEGPAEGWMEKIVQSLYAEDAEGDPRINSLELFFRRESRSILNSRGVDANWEASFAEAEYIVEAGQGRDAVELFSSCAFAALDAEALGRDVARKLAMARDRLSAVPLPKLGALPLVLSGDECMDQWFGYFVDKTSAMAVYQKVSEAAPGFAFTDEGTGDSLGLSMDATDASLPEASPYDQDGLPLSRLPVIEGGVVKALHGEIRGTHYLGLPPAGDYRTASVAPGAATEEELREGPCLEAAAFSDFSMEARTGDFGGELRLGYLIEGGKRTPVTGGSITGNMRDCLPGMRLSSELRGTAKFRAPRSVRVEGAVISGT